MISLIAAIGKNNELGKGNDLLWKFPADMQHFIKMTSGHTVIMGRKTFESIGKSLPNRRNIVITRDKNYKADGAEIAHSLDEAIKIARTAPQPHLSPLLKGEEEFSPFPFQGKAGDEVFIIGGGEIYRQAISVADKLYITHIDAEDINADVFFPEIIPVVWNEVSRQEHQPDEKNIFPYTFSIYKKF